MPFINRQQNQLKPYEAKAFLNWCKTKAVGYFYKYRNAPEVVFNEYKSYLIAKGFDLSLDTDTTRLNAVKLHIEFAIDIYPRFKKFLKLTGSNGVKFGMMYGFSSAASWYNSYKRPVYIRAAMKLLQDHEELLTKINNGNS